jgi:Zn-dependent peptidase ImmA (M78 family)
VDFVSAQSLATTVAHEVVHYWQDHRRGRCFDAEEHSMRERETRRRANLLVPKGTYRTPRGRKQDAWFEPAPRRYPMRDAAEPLPQPVDIAAEALASG